MEKSFGLQFFLRKPRGFKNGEAPIYLRITIDGEPVELSVKRKCDPEKWNSQAACMNGKSDEAMELNVYLTTFQQKYLKQKGNTCSLPSC